MSSVTDFDNVKHWSELASCNGADVNLFFDLYESDVYTAIAVDQLCAGCPVVGICFREGVATKSTGVWGGVYLKDGEVDKAKNSHKSQEFFTAMESIHRRKLRAIEK